MASTTPNRDKLREIFDFIQAHPGSKPVQIARELGMSYSIVRNYIITMEGAGYLLSEDNAGRLRAECVASRER